MQAMRVRAKILGTSYKNSYITSDFSNARGWGAVPPFPCCGSLCKRALGDIHVVNLVDHREAAPILKADDIKALGVKRPALQCLTHLEA